MTTMRTYLMECVKAFSALKGSPGHATADIGQIWYSRAGENVGNACGESHPDRGSNHTSPNSGATNSIVVSFSRTSHAMLTER